MRKRFAIITLLCLLAGLSYGSQTLLSRSWQALSRFQPPGLNLPLRTGATAALTDRVLLILVDGLRPDSLAGLPTVDFLRRMGASYTLKAPPPTFTRPAWATALAGTGPEVHGLTLAEGDQALPVDNLLQAAARKGIRPAVVADAEFGSLVAPWVGTGSYPAVEVFSRNSAEALLKVTAPLLGPKGSRLVILQLGGLHRDGHRTGKAGPEATDYVDSLLLLDRLVAQLLQHVDLSQQTVVLSGTFSVDPAGRHGGASPQASLVPLVLAGKGIKAGEFGQAHLQDLAPTTASLLGLPLPAAATGRPLWPALAAEGEGLKQKQTQVIETQADFWAAYLGALNAGAAGTPPAETTGAMAWLDGLSARAAAARHTGLLDGWRDRLPYVGGFVGAALLYLTVLFFQRFRGPLTVGLISYFAVFHLVFFSQGGSYSLQLPGLEDPVSRGVWLKYGLQALAALLVSLTALGWRLGRSTSRPGYRATSALQSLLALQLVLGLLAAVATALYGWNFRFFMPEPGIVLLHFFALGQALLVGYGAPVWLLYTLIIARLTGGRPVAAEPEPAPPPRVVKMGDFRRTPTSRRGGPRHARH